MKKIVISLCLFIGYANAFAPPFKAGAIGDRMVTLDANGDRVKLTCVNWIGAHMENMVNNGLDFKTVDFISAKIAELGFNCIRLPFALDTYHENPIIHPDRLSANPELIGKSAMEVFDVVVESLTKHGLIVILNNHISTAMWCCSFDDGEGLWYTDKYNVTMWQDILVQMAARYIDNPLVSGMDLRNEVRPANGVAAEWGSGTPQDLALASEIVGNMILEVNPEMLIIAEGILSAGNLIGALIKKPELTNPEKLIYSGHIYPDSPIISDLPYDLYALTMHTMQTFVADAGFNYSAPYWMGEFGTWQIDNNHENWLKMYKFLEENDHDWSYWCIDGYKYNDGIHVSETDMDYPAGILDRTYSYVRDPWKLEQLQKIMPILDDHLP